MITFSVGISIDQKSMLSDLSTEEQMMAFSDMFCKVNYHHVIEFISKLPNQNEFAVHPPTGAVPTGSIFRLVAQRKNMSHWVLKLYAYGTLISKYDSYLVICVDSHLSVCFQRSVTNLFSQYLHYVSFEPRPSKEHDSQGRSSLSRKFPKLFWIHMKTERINLICIPPPRHLLDLSLGQSLEKKLFQKCLHKEYIF